LGPAPLCLKEKVEMTPEIIAKIINSVGLGFDIVGACLVAWEVFVQNKCDKYETQTFDDIGSSPKLNPEYERSENNKYRKMKIGLVMMTIGFLFQLFSNWECLFLRIS
jgi:hypothetical protein